MFDSNAYRTQFNIPADIPIPNEGDTISVDQRDGNPAQVFTLQHAGGGPPVPQKGNNGISDIGTGGIPDTWICDTNGNSCAVPVGSTLGRMGQLFDLNDFGLTRQNVERKH